MKLEIRRITTYVACVASMLTAMRCANPGTPTGGPKDYTPPVLVKSTPEQNATGFSGNMVTLTFDENIQLTDQNTKFVMSPPLAVQPKLDAHGNLLRIRFDSDTVLMPGTTYTCDFADCISDLNEGNKLNNFTFTFSTGESKDSMMISGNVYDAATITPCSGVYVLLQSNLADTAFKTVPPTRIAKTDENGRFAIKNVPAGRQYRIYALDDKNRNFLFDQPGEMIGWVDMPVTPSYETRQINDSVKVDSLCTSTDTTTWVYERTVRDTLVYTPDSLTIYTFTEDNYDQYLSTDERKKKNVMNFIFNKSMKIKPRVEFPGQDKSVSHAVTEYSATNDTVTVWVTDSMMYKADSIVVALTYPVLDSLKNMTAKTDTLEMWFIDKPASKPKKDDKKSRRKRNKEPEKVEVPTLKVNIANNIGVYGVLPLTSETPYGTIDWEGIHLLHHVDTIFEPIAYTHEVDTVNLRRVTLKAQQWIAGDEYKVEIDSAAIYDIYGLQNKQTNGIVKVSPLDKYGTLYIIVSNAPKNGLLQLMVGNNSNVVRQNYLPANGKVAFKYLKPGEYMIRIVCDDNHNGQWDSGNYDSKTQPESTIYFMDKVPVRANWDRKVEFDAKSYNPGKYAQKFRKSNKKK